VGIGIGLAAAVALMTNLASLLKHRGCQHAHPVSFSQPLTSLRGLAARRGVLLAVLAGLLFALAGIAIKALTGGAGSWPLIASLLVLTLACGALAQYTAVAALQSGGAIETIGLMGIVANATQILGGILVFGDPLSPSPLGITLQITALAMVCLSALLLPSSAAARRLQPV
jgi:hypothetical protein